MIADHIHWSRKPGAGELLDKLDVAITAARRPDIVAMTLQSFSENLFSRMPETKLRLILNIDPLWGSQEDAERVIEVCEGHFPEMVVRETEVPLFSEAVRWCWSQVETQWFMHLEDDWIATRPIDVGRLRRELAKDNTAFVRLNHKWNSPRTWLHRKRFTLTPSFIRKELATLLLPHLEDTTKDPLDVIALNVLPSMKLPWTFRVHGPLFADPIVADIGRTWRENRGIAKFHDKENRRTWWAEEPD